MSEAENVKGRIVENTVIEAGQPWGRNVKKDQRIRFIDLKGLQALDFLCYNADDPSDRYNAANTMKMARNIYITKGVSLWSDRAVKLMTVVEDTCGFHDTIGGCCSFEMNMLRYNKTAAANCRDTFEKALKPFGLSRPDIATNINFFMYVPVNPDGEMAIVDGRSKAGDYIDLVADHDVICVASNCAQLYNPCNGFNPTPVRAITYEPANPR